MEITKREVVASVTIIAIMLLVGVLLFGKISERKMDENEKYNKAVEINSTELFRYGMSTSIGNAFVYGDLVALDPVTYSEIGGEYLSVQKVKERYTMHTRTVTSTVNGNSTTRTETYWTWDVVGRESKDATRVEFCEIEFYSSQFILPTRDYIKTIKTSSHVRYKYYGSPTKTTGTIFADLRDGNIGEQRVSFYRNKTIEETIESVTSNFSLILFWIFWIAITGFVIYGFYYLENRWLE